MRHHRDRFRYHRRSSEQGVALIATLVFLFILTVIVVLFLGDVEDRVRYRAQTAGNEDLRRIAKDYLTHTLGVLQEFEQFDGPFVSAMQGWGDPLAYAPFPVQHEGLVARVSVEDAATQLPLSLLDESSFTVLMESLGLDGFTAMRLRDVYFDWIDADEETRIRGAEAREYENDRRYVTFTPANQPMQDALDFRYLMGFRDWLNAESRDYHPERFERLRSMVTAEHNAPVNLNVAGPAFLVFLEQLQGLDPVGLQRYLAGRDQIPGTEDDRWIDLSGSEVPAQLRTVLGTQVSSALFSASTRLLRIEIELERHQSYVYRMEVLIETGAPASSPSTAAPEPAAPEDGGEAVGSDGQQPTQTSATSSSTSSFEVLVIRENM